jgi:hypothetical protein
MAARYSYRGQNLFGVVFASRIDSNILGKKSFLALPILKPCFHFVVVDEI